MGVIWKSVLNGGYEVSNDGRVRRAKKGRGRTFVGREMKLNKLNHGHLYISAWDFEKKKRRRWLVHRLVALAFIGPCPDGMEVNHKDDNPENNVVENLEYISHAGNIKHGYRNKKGEKHHASKFSDDLIMKIVALRRSGVTAADLRRKFGVTEQSICGWFHGRGRAKDLGL